MMPRIFYNAGCGTTSIVNVVLPITIIQHCNMKENWKEMLVIYLHMYSVFIPGLCAGLMEVVSFHTKMFMSLSKTH